uniref:Uncharacterized protein n=1 Tax=Avena sativa TaxID=4498 RepID=A0ACD5U656_AVESA
MAPAGTARSPAAMSVACGLECVLCVGCLRWAWKRLTYIGAYGSENWPLAVPDDLEPVPRICQIIMAIYEDDIAKPKFAPPGLGYDDICSEGIHKLATYAHVKTNCPPYIVYADRQRNEVVLAVRGLNLVRNADYKVLMDNKLGQQMFDGGYVHYGLLKAAQFILEKETDTLQDLLRQQGHGCRPGRSSTTSRRSMIFPGATYAATRSRPPAACRSTSPSSNADVIYSIVLQVPPALLRRRILAVRFPVAEYFDYFFCVCVKLEWFGSE